MFQPYRDTPTAYGGIVRTFPDGHVVVIKRDFGLTWQRECSREAHRQAFLYIFGYEAPPEYFQDDPPSDPPAP